MARRALALAVVLATALSLLLVAPPAAHADTVTDESAFVERINALRASKGLPALKVDAELTAIARRWAAKMSAAGQISHNPNFADEVTANWKKIGENVGMGGTIDTLHQAFVDSPSHYRNLVDGDFEYVGIGVVYDGNGTIFVAEQFMKLFPAEAPAAPPAPVAAAPAPPAAAPAAPAPAAAAVAAAPAVPTTTTTTPPPAPTRVEVVLEQLQALESHS